jgi:hypothetical protein
METKNNKKEKFVLRIYSILILLYAVFDIITGILPKFVPITIKPNINFINYFFTITGIALYTTPINMIVGYGLLRRRFWARYGAITVMLTFPVHVLTQFLWWGAQSLNDYAIVVEFLFVILTLLYFSRRSAKAVFGETRPFRFISWHGLLAVLIILISFSWVIFSLYWKVHAAWKFGYPFFIDRPQVIILEKPKSSETLVKYQKVELLNVSLLMPKEFGIRSLTKIEGKNQKWVVSLQNQGVHTKAFIKLGNNFIYDDLLIDEPFWKILGSGSEFNLEKYILTNNWNPRLVVIRSLIRPKGGSYEIKEIHRNDLRGFLKGWQRGEAFFKEFSVYNREDTQSISGTIMSIKGYLDENDVLTILSSIEFLKPEDSGQSNNHYEKGLNSYKQGDILQTQVEFANAYFLSPENPDIIFMFAKSLLIKEPENDNYVKALLNKVLKLRPDHKGAQKLLKEMEPKLPKKARK